MYFFEAYGLGIRSTIPLPELIPASDITEDVVIQLGKVERSVSEIKFRNYSFYMSGEDAYFVFDEIGTFLVRDGKEIIIDALPGVEESLVRLPLLSMAFAILLHQRGFLVMHGSAVAINNDVVAFTAGSGWGKSTMAATLYARGHQLMADDLMAVDVSNMASPMVYSGFPQMKLWPQSAAFSLGDDPETLPRLIAGYEKRARKITARFSQKPLPLRQIYVISAGSVPEIKPLQPQEAMLQVMSHSYIAIAAKPLIQGVGGSSHFRQCTSLINSVRMYSLKRPSSLELLPAIAQMVEENLARDINLNPSFAPATSL